MSALVVAKSGSLVAGAPGLLSALYVSTFFFNDTATTEIYALSLHDALPIYDGTAMASRMPRMMMTTRSSIRVKPCSEFRRPFMRSSIEVCFLGHGGWEGRLAVCVSG